jgi:class 3 adenylate cyclase
VEPRIQYCTAPDGVKIAYWKIGEGGTPLIMTSPLAISNISLEWEIPRLRAWYESLSRGRTLLRYDSRGQGMSQRDVDDFGFDAVVGDLTCLAEQMSGQADVIAYAGNGMWTIGFAASQPEKIRRLVLWSCPIEAFKPEQRKQLELALQMAESNWDLAIETFSHMSVGWGRGHAGHDWATFLKSSITQEAFLKGWKEWIDPPTDRLLSMLPKIKAPTLVIDQDFPSVGRRHARRLASEIPNAQLLRLEGGPSAAWDNERGVSAVEDFLSDGTTSAPPAHLAGSGTAIILFLDIADSTALTETLGDAAFRAKSRDLDGALRKIIREHEGTPIEGKLLGDGVLAIFTSARQAIACAATCHSVAEEVGLELHAGIHAGDVIREENNVYGGAVNIAARVASASAPGETLVSQTVRDLARTSAGVSFDDRGEQALKGIEDPVRVFAVRAGGA